MVSPKFLFFVTFTWEWERGETSVLCSASIWVLHFKNLLQRKHAHVAWMCMLVCISCACYIGP